MWIYNNAVYNIYIYIVLLEKTMGQKKDWIVLLQDQAHVPFGERARLIYTIFTCCNFFIRSGRICSLRV